MNRIRTRVLAAATLLAATAGLLCAAAGSAAAQDQTYQGHYTENGMDCKVFSVMVVGTDGKPHSTLKTICEPIKK